MEIVMYEESNGNPYPNFRDLGGFVTRGGRQTKTGVFFRSGAPLKCGPEESAFLRKNRIRTVLDFRIEAEKNTPEWDETGLVGTDYIRLPYYDPDGVEIIREMERRGSIDWPVIYTLILERGDDWIRRTFLALALSEEAVLFHCASGKDRTGVIAALLLDLAEADDVWILADYAMTWYDLPHDGSFFYNTSPETMQSFLRLLREKYHGSHGYLREIGVPENMLMRIRNRILE